MYLSYLALAVFGFGSLATGMAQEVGVEGTMEMTTGFDWGREWDMRRAFCSLIQDRPIYNEYGLDGDNCLGATRLYGQQV
jgi:hypothetical protein